MELIIYFAVALVIGIWMYNDAKKRKVEQPVTWLFVGILLGFIGLITYWYWHIYPSKTTKH